MKLKLRGQDLLIVGVYAPNNVDKAVKQKFFEELGELINTFEWRKDIFLQGDFNGRISWKGRVQWQEYTGKICLMTKPRALQKCQDIQ